MAVEETRTLVMLIEMKPCHCVICEANADRSIDFRVAR